MGPSGITPDLQTPQKFETSSTHMESEAQIVQLETGSRVNVSRKLILNTEVLRKVASDANDYPLAIIAIAGPSQSSNSFVLAYIVRYLQALERNGDGNAGDWMHKNKPDVITKDEGFAVRSGVDQATEGIWMWTRRFIIKRSKTESPIAVLVMATQGCFNPATNEQEQFSMIGLSLLLSSCFIYNDARLIDESTINTLSQFMDYGRVASESFEGKAFQRLAFLIRESNALGFNPGAVGGLEFIRKCLILNHGMTLKTPQNSTLVTDNFEDCNAYIIPLQGEHIISEQEHVEKFVVNLVTDVAPKRFGSILAFGKTFCDTFENLLTAFNAEDKPSPSSKLDVIVGLGSQIYFLSHEYEEKFLRKLQSNPAPFVSSDALLKYHEKFMTALKNKFKGGLRWRQICSHKDKHIFENKLTESLELKFSEIRKQNTINQNAFIETTQQSSIQKLQDFIEQNIFNTPKIWCQTEYEHSIASFREDITKEFLKATNGIANADGQFTSKLQETVHWGWLQLEVRKAKTDKRATQIIEKWLSHYKQMLIDNSASEKGLPNESQLESLHEKNKIIITQNASNELKKEIVDHDYIRVYENLLDQDMKAHFESIKVNLKTQIEDILGIMENDLHEVVTEFKQQAHIEMQNFSSLENPNIEAIFKRNLDKGIKSLNSHNHPDPQVVAKYIKQLTDDMNTALKEINSLQSRKVRRHQFESYFKDATQEFLKEIEAKCPPTDILEVHEVESIVVQLAESIRPKYERMIQETSPEYFTEFSQNFDKLVAKEKQKNTSSNLEKLRQLKTIIQSCLQFADNHPILLERSLADSSEFDVAQEKLISDVRRYYDKQGHYPAQSSGQVKAKAWDRIHDELLSKCQVLFNELRAKSEEESRIINQITESILANVCPKVLSSLDSGRYFEDATLRNLLREAARNEFQGQVSRTSVTLLLGYKQTFDKKLDIRLDELSKMNAKNTQVVLAKAEETCQDLFNKWGELIKSEVDLDNLRGQAENTVREFLQTKSMDPITETSTIGSKLHSFIERLHQKLLEESESSVTSDRALQVTEDAAKNYSKKMREFLLSRSPVNPENLLEFHHFSVKTAIKRSKNSCFITKSLDSAIRDRLEYSYGIFQERNYLSHAQDSNLTIGIDLGTTTSCVAVYNNGDVTVISDEAGHTLIPCYVYFHEDGSPIAGNNAKNQGIFSPESTIFDAQRMVGWEFNDSQIQNAMKTWPFKIESDKNGRPLIVTKGKRFSPEEVIAEILRHMRKLAEKHLERSVTKAVITVPTNFTDKQRGATRQAALLAGLEVLQIINEPSAAAMAYSLHRKNEKKIILVFNFGGRTFEVTILKPKLGSTNATDFQGSPSSSGIAAKVQETQSRRESRLQILRTGGDTHLGGDDFDNTMVMHCAEKFRQQHGIQLLKADGSTTGARDDLQHIRRLKNACEKAKTILTSEHSATVEVDRIHGDLHLKVPISRLEFERMNDKLLQKAIDIVKKTIEDAHLKPGDITDVLMVGGSSRIPRVRQLLQDFLNIPILDINQKVDIQEAVARGAAIQACVLNGEVSIKNLPLCRNIQPFSVGIKLNTGNMSVIIRRNTRIPCEGSRTFTPIQENLNAISFDIYIGEDRLVEDNLFLKTMKLEGIPPGPGDSQKVTLQMKIDANGILHVTASTPEGPSSTITIQECRGQYSDEEVRYNTI